MNVRLEGVSDDGSFKATFQASKHWQAKTHANDTQP